MASNRLQLYRGSVGPPGASSPQPPLAPRETVAVPMGDVIPWLADAAIRRRAWLNDFREEEITISRDLYEIILAYRRYHRPSA